MVCVCVVGGRGVKQVYIIGMVSQCSEFKLHYFKERERVCVCARACVISNVTEVLPPCIPRIWRTVRREMFCRGLYWLLELETAVSIKRRLSCTVSVLGLVVLPPPPPHLPIVDAIVRWCLFLCFPPPPPPPTPHLPTHRLTSLAN